MPAARARSMVAVSTWETKPTTSPPVTLLPRLRRFDRAGEVQVDDEPLARLPAELGRVADQLDASAGGRGGSGDLAGEHQVAHEREDRERVRRRRHRPIQAGRRGPARRWFR